MPSSEPGVDMRRRDFITLVGGTAAAWPAVTRAQQAIPVIGFLHSGAPQTFGHFVIAFRQGLGEVGYIEGQNVTIEYRWAEGQYDRLSDFAADLVSRQVAVIVTFGNVPALAIKAVTVTIPHVFTIADDPVKFGLVASLNRPAGNATGVSQLTNMLEAKRLEVLRELVPKITAVAVLTNPNNPSTEPALRDLQDGALALGLQLLVLNAGKADDIEAAFASLVRQGVGALVVVADAALNDRRHQIVALATRHSVATIYSFREFVASGGLISYGPNLADTVRQVGVYAGRILKGFKPADLPVIQPTKFELVINLKTAKALGLTVPPTLLARADEVIE
jgi:putative ABC transport system substrate-binding protein